MAKCLGKCYIIGAGNYYESWLDMFYEISDEIRILDKWEADSKNLCFACISSQELREKGSIFGFDEETILASQKENRAFRTGVDVHENYTFTKLRILQKDGNWDFISIYFKKNLLLIVDIKDDDESTRESFLNALKKFPIKRINLERLISCFFEILLRPMRKMIMKSSARRR